jgi:hypothetical protein
MVSKMPDRLESGQLRCLFFYNRDDTTTRRLTVAKTAQSAVPSRRRVVAVIKTIGRSPIQN